MRRLAEELLLLSMVLCLRSLHAQTDSMMRRTISNSDALCNDFSPALFYKSETGSNKSWIIFFEGGGGCSSIQECNEKWLEYENLTNRNPIMSSESYIPEIEGTDLLSSDPSINPLYHNFTRILVPYCSKDAFLADRDNPNVSPSMIAGGYRVKDVNFNNSIDADNFVYKGRVIFQSVILQLMEDEGLAEATKVLLAGSSAGGIGILNHLDWVESVFTNTTNTSSSPAASSGPDLLVIIDSSWFVTFMDSQAVEWTQAIPGAFDLPLACHDFSLGFSCCISPACLFGKGYIKSRVPILAISSSHDIFTLEDPLTESLNSIQPGQQARAQDDLLRIFNGYGSIMNESFVQSLNSYPNLSIFAPACTQHVFLATSSLWRENGLLYQSTLTEIERTPFFLYNPIRSGIWDMVRVETHDPALNISLQEAIRDWYTNPHSSRFYVDTCTGPVCGNFCPSDVELRPERYLWPMYLNIFVLIVAALFTAIPSLVKIGLYANMKYILFCQRLYYFNMKDSPKPFPKATVPINVACIELNYRIDVVSKRAGSKQSAAGSAIDPQCVEDRYDIYAGVETFVPCCKNICSVCINRYNAPVRDENLQTTAEVQLVKTDVGCSSSGSNRMRNATSNSLDSMSMDSMDMDGSRSSLVDAGYQSRENDMLQRSVSSLRREKRSIRKKTILHHMNMYVNPGELVAIMGPSGSGKTTLLDVLLGRRSAGHTEGDILVNGIPLHKIRKWFTVNSGYVRQLAKSYYDELTVRENLIFSMNMQAPKGMKLSQKLERVEQVIRETGLLEQADIKVGDGIGLGLSGGQRKRLAIAVQLLSMPNIIFLDEPTSGLDSASSLDILKSLQVMAGTGRAIVVTIHQPRSEIFHAFDKILLLCNGKIAFFGSPVKVWEFFREALISEKKLSVSEGQVQDAVLDLLKEKRSQKQVLHAYKESKEPGQVQRAVLESKHEHVDFPQQTQSRNPGLWQRLVSLESRSSLRQTFFTITYLPIVYTVFGLVLGTTYKFTTFPVQVMSVTCLLSCSSSLFMSSIIASLLVEPLKLFYLEHSDGISMSFEVVLQVFIRMTALSTLPLSICATIVFALVYQNYAFSTYMVILLAFLLVNQVWICIFIILTVLSPSQAHRLCPVFAAIGGFCCGFIVPKPLMPEYYRWIFYINPSFYAYAATSVTALSGNDLGCDRDSVLECFRDSGVVILETFGLSDVNPIENLVVLMVMVIVCLFIGICILQVRVNFGLIKEKLFNTFCAASKRQRRKRITSMELLRETVDHPTAMLTNVVMRKDPCKANGKTSRENKKEFLRNLTETKPSSQFLENGYHYIMHDFPWKREELMHDLDLIDGPSGAPTSNLYSPMSVRDSRIISDGSEDVFEAEQAVSEVMIDMEEDRNEEQRRLQANLKWNLRRQKIENEFLRLRHLSINKSRASGGMRLRHSVSFGDDLEIQLENSGLRNLEADGEERVKESLDPSLTKRSMTLGSKSKPFIRSMSTPSKGVDDHLNGHSSTVPKLETHVEFTEEEEGEEGEEEGEEEEVVGMLGLPPKDVPNVGFSMEQLDWTETDNDEVD